MSTSSLVTPPLVIRDIPVQVVRKPIQNLHLSVCPPDGQVRVAVPLHITDDNVRLAVIARLGWIKKQQAAFAGPAPPVRAHPGEWRKPLCVWSPLSPGGDRTAGSPRGCGQNPSILQLWVNPGTTQANRDRCLKDWYRQQLKDRIPALLAHWQPRIGEAVSAWGIKKMKTKWGSCNSQQRRIWLNLELAKKPVDCLEYVLVH
jgi:predicted metal-dependent hydrolase